MNLYVFFRIEFTYLNMKIDKSNLNDKFLIKIGHKYDAIC